MSKGKYIRLSDYYIQSNKEIIIEPNNRDNYWLKIGDRRALKIILNARILGILHKDIDFSFACYNSSDEINEIEYGKKNLKKVYDGTSTFTSILGIKIVFILLK